MRNTVLFVCIVTVAAIILGDARNLGAQTGKGRITLAHLRELKHKFNVLNQEHAEHSYERISLQSNLVPVGMEKLSKEQLVAQLPMSKNEAERSQQELIALWHEQLQPLEVNVEAERGQARLEGGLLRKARLHHLTYFDDPTLPIPPADTTDLSNVDVWKELNHNWQEDIKGMTASLQLHAKRLERLLGRGYETLGQPLDESSYALGTLHLPPDVLKLTRDPIYVVDLKTGAEEGPFVKVELFPSSDDRFLDLFVNDVEGNAYDLPLRLK